MWAALSRSLLLLATTTLLVTSACASIQGSPGEQPTTLYTNAEWWTGEAFERGERFIAGNVFAARGGAVDTIDLQGRWVIPAFGDAHTHNLDGDTSTLAEYRREGVFYVQVLGNTREGAAKLSTHLQQPGQVDVVYANGILTGPFGHPVLAYEPRAMGLDWSAFRANRANICASKLMHGRAYWEIDDVPKLDELWPQIIAGNPGVLKVVLMRGAEQPVKPTCADLGAVGLAPELVGEVVRRASRTGLRVWAHIENLNDARIALQAGVFGLAHLPGYSVALRPADDVGTYLVDSATAQAMADADVVITPTVALAHGYARGDSTALARAHDVHRRNLAQLRRYGVRIAVGSDNHGQTAWNEVAQLAGLRVLEPRDILTIWAVTTPRAIFPHRRIGALTAGYEATFLVLDCNPLRTVDCLQAIRLRVKDGRRLNE
jgi:imidazolonepropionase-like amidohydrolase